MKTFFALAMVPFWQCLAEDCFETFGSCAGKQASLMQFKVLNQKKQALSLEGQESVSGKLAAFQKFTNEMVEEYGEPASKEPSNDVKSAVYTVLEFIENMFGHLNTYHLQDNQTAGSCSIGAETHCNSVHMTSDVSNRLKNASNMSDHYQALHRACMENDTLGTEDECGGVLAECREACAGNGTCDRYHKGRGNRANVDPVLYGIDTTHAQAPLCIADGHFADSYITALEGTQQLAEMEQCLVDTDTWLDYLYPLYDACKRSDDCCDQAVRDCDALQAQFEEKRCIYFEQSNGECSAIQTCVTDRYNQCNNECTLIEMRSAARAADNETGQRLVCLLHALFGKPTAGSTNTSQFDPRPNSTARPVELEKCKSASIDTSYWEIPCAAQRGSTSSADQDLYQCPDQGVSKPCDNGFIAEVYTGNSLEESLTDPREVALLTGTSLGLSCSENAQRGWKKVITQCTACSP